MTKYLDENGLAYFWTKIKAWLSSHAPVKYFGRNWVEDTLDEYALVVGNGADENNLNDSFTIAKNGDVNANNGAFAGDISADDGAFTGDISADNISIVDYADVGRDVYAQGFLNKMDNITKDVTPQSDQWKNGVIFYDKDNVFMGGVQFCDASNSQAQYVQFGSRKSDSSQNIIRLGNKNNSAHTPITYLNAPLAFLDALSHADGVQVYGGTAGADIITPGSGITFSNTSCAYRWGRFVWLRLEWYRNVSTSVSASGDTANYNVGKLKHFWPVGFLHAYTTWESIAHSTKCDISGDGTITCTGAESGNSAYTINANTWFSIIVCYMSAADPS